MIRVLVFSDSHGSVSEMFEVVRKIPNVEHIIHLGDIYRDVVALLDEFSDIKIHFVQGNNDPYHNYDTEKLIRIDEIPIFITHGHNYSLSSGAKALLASDKAKKAKIILYGHTHMQDYHVFEDKIIANPGSISRPRYGMPSYGIIEIENGEIGYSNIEIF